MVIKDTVITQDYQLHLFSHSYILFFFLQNPYQFSEARVTVS